MGYTPGRFRKKHKPEGAEWAPPLEEATVFGARTPGHGETLAGQALAYKIGPLKILELRAPAEKALARFDIRRSTSRC